MAGLERLTERFQRGPIELCQLIEKKDTMMGKRDLTGTGARPAADERRQRGRMMRVAERPLTREMPSGISARAG